MENQHTRSNLRKVRKVINRGKPQSIIKQDLYRCVLVLIITLLTFVPNASLIFIPSNINKPQVYGISVKSQQSRSQANQPLIKHQNNPISLISSLKKVNIDSIEINIKFGHEVFDGFNLFVLEQRNRTDHDDKRAILLITDMNGDIIAKNEIKTSYQYLADYSAEFVNSSTILIRIDDNLALWNYYTNFSQIFEVKGGHHDFEYNPLTNTFLTLEKIYTFDPNGTVYRFDEILEYNARGEIIWSLDTRSFIFPSHWCPYHDMIGGKVEITHANSLFWDLEEDIIFVNMRNTNTFYKIDHKTGKVIWGLGEYGNFSLFDKDGIKRSNLFYHAHSVEKVDDNTFILFDNNFHNQIKPMSSRSRIIEIKINETTMTANETWSWAAPKEYYCSYWGDADRLPNGNRLGAFGTRSHPDTQIGARLVEVNNEGELVWEMNFQNTEEYEYGVYRMERFRFSPISTEFKDIKIPEKENLTVLWQTWYNFRSKKIFNGSYTLLLDNEQIESGNHTFDKFWRPTNLTFELKQLKNGDHNLTLMLEDEEGHSSTNSINIVVSTENPRKNPLFEILTLSFGLLCIAIPILLFLKNYRK